MLQKVIDAGVDYVILASPPAFRPAQLEYAVEKGIHCFYEKPVAVDAPGIRKVIELAKKAKEKKLGFMSGFCGYNFPKRAVFSRVLDGAVGDINAMYSTYNAGEVGGNRGRTGAQSDLEIQMQLAQTSLAGRRFHCGAGGAFHRYDAVGHGRGTST